MNKPNPHNRMNRINVIQTSAEVVPKMARGKSSNFGGKKAAPFVSRKNSPGKANVGRKKSSTKTARGTKKK